MLDVKIRINPFMHERATTGDNRFGDSEYVFIEFAKALHHCSSFESSVSKNEDSVTVTYQAPNQDVCSDLWFLFRSIQATAF